MEISLPGHKASPDDFQDQSIANFSSTSLDDESSEPLVVEVESPAESALALLQASKALLKKLTMLAVVADKDVPDSLRKLFENINEDDGLEVSVAANGKPTPSPVFFMEQPTVTRAKNFKHKKLANYYKTVNTVEAGVYILHRKSYRYPSPLSKSYFFPLDE